MYGPIRTEGKDTGASQCRYSVDNNLKSEQTNKQTNTQTTATKLNFPQLTYVYNSFLVSWKTSYILLPPGCKVAQEFATLIVSEGRQLLGREAVSFNRVTAQVRRHGF